MTTEVRTKLTLDDGSSSVLKRIKSGFTDVSGARDQAQAGMSMLGQTLSTMAAVHGPALVRSVAGWGKSFLDAAASEQESIQSMGGLIAVMQHVPWSEAHAQASALDDDIDDLAIRSGLLGDDVQAGFSTLLEITGATAAGVASAKTQMEQMAPVARVLNMSAGDVAREFALMGEGMLRTKGRLFQLLQSTGIFGDNTKKAAAAWAQLTETQRADRLSAALKNVSSQLGEVPATYQELINSLENTWDVFKETFGGPMLDAVMPALRKLQHEIRSNQGDIEDVAKTMGSEVGEWVTAAAQEIKEGFEYLKTHKEEIRDAIIDAMNAVKSTVSFILAHKEEIAIAFGAKAAMGSSTLGGLVKTGMGVGKGVYGMGSAGTSVGGAALSGVGGGLAALGAFAAALLGAAAAADQFSKLLDETGGSPMHGDEQQGYDALQKRFKEMISDPSFAEWDKDSLKHFEAMRRNILKYSDELGENSRAAGELADQAFDAHKAARKMVAPIDEAAKSFSELYKAEGGMVDVKQQEELVGTISTGFQQAMNAQNSGAMNYVATLLTKSSALAGAFLQSAQLTSGGFDALADLVASKGAEFAELADQLRAMGKLEAGKAAKPAAPKLSMGGGNVFKIQQDFRDQDPDRIAIVFQQAIGRSVMNRLGASTSSPFGT